MNKHIVLGLFSTTDDAQHAIDDLKEKGYGEDISIIARSDEHENVDSVDIIDDTTPASTSPAAKTGAVAGGITGAIAALFSGITALAIPGIGFVVGGPLAALLGLGGAATGALAGGLIGSLVDMGLPEDTARSYEEKVRGGHVLLGVTSDHEDELGTIERVLDSNEAVEVHHIDISKGSGRKAARRSHALSL